MGIDFMGIDFKDKKVMDIMRDGSLYADQKAEMLGCETDMFFQNIVDMDGNVIQQTKDIFGYDLKEIINENDLTGKTFLDLGCNVGAYLFGALKMGADKAIGVDNHRYVEKYIELLGVGDRVDFFNENILMFSPKEEVNITILFDVMCYFSDTEALKLVENTLSYTKDKIVIADVFSGDYSKHFYKIIKHIRSKGFSPEIRVYECGYDMKVIDIKI